MYVMVDFICMGFLKLQGVEADLQNEKFFLSTAGFELTTPRFGGQRRNH